MIIMTKASGKHPFNLLAYRHAVRAYYTHHLRQTPPPTAYNARNITTSPRVDPRLLLASYPEESTAFFSLFSFFLSFFLLLLPLPLPPPATTTLFSPHGLYFLRATLTIPVFTAMRRLFPTRKERKKERKIFSKERKISFLASFPRFLSRNIIITVLQAGERSTSGTVETSMITPRPRRDSRFYEAIFGSRARARSRPKSRQRQIVFGIRARNDTNDASLSLSLSSPPTCEFTDK